MVYINCGPEGNKITPFHPRFDDVLSWTKLLGSPTMVVRDPFYSALRDNIAIAASTLGGAESPVIQTVASIFSSDPIAEIDSGRQATLLLAQRAVLDVLWNSGSNLRPVHSLTKNSTSLRNAFVNVMTRDVTALPSAQQTVFEDTRRRLFFTLFNLAHESTISSFIGEENQTDFIEAIITYLGKDLSTVKPDAFENAVYSKKLAAYILRVLASPDHVRCPVLTAQTLDQDDNLIKIVKTVIGKEPEEIDLNPKYGDDMEITRLVVIKTLKNLTQHPQAKIHITKLVSHPEVVKIINDFLNFNDPDIEDPDPEVRTNRETGKIMLRQLLTIQE